MAESALVCRPIRRDELGRSAEIVAAAFGGLSASSEKLGTPDAQVVAKRLEEYLDEEGVPGILFGGFAGEEQLGFFMLHKLGIDEETWEISMLSVSPARQGQGLGGRLLDAALGEILRRGGVLAVCAVTEGNQRTLGLLAARDFVCEASGVPVGGALSIWMLRRDMQNPAAARAAAQEAARDGCSGCSGDACSACAEAE